MKIEIRNDTAEISGYVNAVGRDSRPIPDVRGKFVEQIEPGAFRAALERAEDVKLLLNHDKSREYASVKGGNLTLTEDSIGLRAHAVITDAELIGKARNGELRGWSFGMYVNDAEMEERAEGIPRRHVKGLDIFEVSLIDKAKMPCYAGTSVECRSDDGEQLAELRSGADEEPEISEERSEPIDYSAVDDMIAEVRYGAVDNMLAEVRFNPYHDPSNGRFTSGGGGGGGAVLIVNKGEKGKDTYVIDMDHDDEYEKWKQAKSDGGVSAADKAIREATGGVIRKDEYTEIEAVATKRNKKARTTYDKSVLSAEVDENGNVTLKYAQGEYSGNYGDEVQNVTYRIKAGAVDGVPVNLDLSKASSISGSTYEVKDAAKAAGMKWNSDTSSWVKSNHIINTSTKFTDSELAAKSDSEINAIYKAGYYKFYAAKGYTLRQIDAKASTLPKRTREEQIAAISRFNARNA